MALLRSLVFYPVFYGVSAVLVLSSIVAVALGREKLRGVVATWGNWHRWCLRTIMGVEIVIDGELPDEPVLIAVKHESYFEAIDMPRLFRFPNSGILRRRPTRGPTASSPNRSNEQPSLLL